MFAPPGQRPLVGHPDLCCRLGGSAELFSAGWHGRRVIDMDLKAMPVAPSAVVGSSCAPRTVPKGHIASTYTSGHISKFKHDRLPYTGHAASLPAPRAEQLKVAAWQHGGMRLAQELFCSGRIYRVLRTHVRSTVSVKTSSHQGSKNKAPNPPTSWSHREEPFFTLGGLFAVKYRIRARVLGRSLVASVFLVLRRASLAVSLSLSHYHRSWRGIGYGYNTCTLHKK